MTHKHVADTPSQAECEYERGWTGKPCTGYVDIVADHQFGRKPRLCPRHAPNKYANRKLWSSGARHAGKPKWWKR